jgi:cell division protein FtsI (penicillin-binding protein 3)
MNSSIRIKIFLLIALLISFLLIFRVIYLSSINPQDYNMVESAGASFQRGDIYDKNNKLLATSLVVDSVYANPKEIKDKNRTISIISQILELNKNVVSEKIKLNKNFVWLKRQISPVKADLLKKYNLEGVYFKKEYKRFYPNKNIASQIIGFCNIDNNGVEGVEKSFDSYLLPTFKSNNLSQNDDIIGNNITLTIDSNIQAIAESVLKTSIIDENAESGTLVFADGTSGEVIALANYPDFDPNRYTDFNQKYFRNLAIFNQYEPGSVFKIFTIASILDAGLMTKDEYFMCNGAFHKYGLTVKDTGVHGMVNISKIFKYSCNVGTLEAASRMKNADLYSYLKKFGFGESASMMLIGEQSGLFRDISLWTTRSMLAVPIGQEISVNAMQIVRATTTFFNDGVMLEPYIVKSIVNTKNQPVFINHRKEIRRVIDKGISDQIITAMGATTDEIGGTARLLKIEGLSFGAKSGTAEIYDPKTKRYSDTDVTSSLLAVFPLEKPKYIAYVIFHKPKKGRAVQWGGIIGANLLRNFISNLTGYLEMNDNESVKILEKDIKNTGSSIKKVQNHESLMPDLKGMSAGNASDIFSNLNIKIQIYGSGFVYDQDPEPETELKGVSEIKLYLKE